MITINTLGETLIPRYKGEKIKMSELEKKAEKRYFVAPPKPVKLKKPKKVDIPEPKESKTKTKIIIGDPKSSGPFVKEQVIKLDKSAGERGKGPGSKPSSNVTIGSRTKPKAHPKSSKSVRRHTKPL